MLRKPIFLTIALLLLALFVSGYMRPRFGGEIVFFAHREDKWNINALMNRFPHLLSEPFFMFNNGRLSSNVFESYEWNEDATELLLKLAADTRWSDASLIRSSDVAECVKHVLTEKGYRDVSIYSTPSELVLRFEFPPKPVFKIFWILSNSYLVDKGKIRWSGPFVPSGNPAGDYVLRANRYSLSGRPYLDAIYMKPAQRSLLISEIMTVTCGLTEVYEHEMSHLEGLLPEAEKRQNNLFFIKLNDNIKPDLRAEICSILSCFDMINGLTAGKGKIVSRLFPQVTLPQGAQFESTKKENTNPLNDVNSEEFRIVFPDEDFHSKLARRVSAILVSTGLKTDLKPIEANGNHKEICKDKEWDICISSINICDAGEALTMAHLGGWLNAIGWDKVSALSIKWEVLDVDKISELESWALQEHRLFYLFSLKGVRVASCGIRGNWSLSEIWIR